VDAYEVGIKLQTSGSRFSLNFKGFHCDACKLPFKDGSFDAVMSFEFFEHVANTDQAIAEQLRLLKVW